MNRVPNLGHKRGKIKSYGGRNHKGDFIRLLAMKPCVALPAILVFMCAPLCMSAPRFVRVGTTV
jgi:hypothetical protein